MCARRKKRNVIIIRVNNFKKLHIPAFLNLSNCSFYFIVCFNKVSILTYPLIKIYGEIRFTMAITNKLLWWGGWSPHHFSLHHSLCLETSILRHLHTTIRESILLSNHYNRIIGQSPYQSRVQTVASRCVYKPSIIQLFVWVFIYMCLVAFYLSLHYSRISLRAHPLPFHISDHGAISLTYFIFNYQIAFLYTTLSSSPLVFHLRSSRSIKKLGPQY